MNDDLKQHLTKLTKEQITDSSGNVFKDLGLDEADTLFDEAVRHIRAWVAWCDGPADPHPLDSLRDARAFLARIDEGGEG